MSNFIAFPHKTEYPKYAEMYMKYIKRDGTLLQQFEDNFFKKSPMIIKENNYFLMGEKKNSARREVNF